MTTIRQETSTFICGLFSNEEQKWENKEWNRVLQISFYGLHTTSQPYTLQHYALERYILEPYDSLTH